MSIGASTSAAMSIRMVRKVSGGEYWTTILEPINPVLHKNTNRAGAIVEITQRDLVKDWCDMGTCL